MIKNLKTKNMLSEILLWVSLCIIFKCIAAIFLSMHMHKIKTLSVNTFNLLAGMFYIQTASSML